MTPVHQIEARPVMGNLWTTQPPLQIDANFGYAAGVNKMLVQSHLGEVALLPALPKIWSTGSFTGLRVRGDFAVDLEWKDGALTRAALRNLTSESSKATIRSGKSVATVTVAKGKTRELKPTDFN